MLTNLKLVVLRTVRDQAAVFVKVLEQRAAHVLFIKVHRTDIAAALDKAKHLGIGPRMERASLAALGRLGEIGFVRFDGLASATNGTIGRRCHRKANTVSHVPRGLHAHVQGALKLARANTFLGRTHEVDRLKPEAKRSVGVLEDAAHLDREGLAALIALAKSGARCLAVQLADLRAIAIAAVRAYRASGPQKRLNVFIRGCFVVEMRGFEYRGHVRISRMEKSYA